MLSGEADGKAQGLDVINHDDICSLKRYEQEGPARHEIVLAPDADETDRRLA